VSEDLHSEIDEMIKEMETNLLAIIEKLGKHREAKLMRKNLNFAKDRSLSVYTRLSYIDLALRNAASALGEDIRGLWKYEESFQP